MKKLTVLCDLDDVLWGLVPAWLKALNDTHNLSVSEKDITSWYMPAFFPTLNTEQLFAPLYKNR